MKALIFAAFFLSLYRTGGDYLIMRFAHPYATKEDCAIDAAAVTDPGVTYAVCRPN